VFRAVVLADGDEVGVADFPQIAALAQRQPMPAADMASPSVASPATAPLPMAAQGFESQQSETQGSLAPSHLQEIATPGGSIAPQQQPETGLTLPLLDAQGEVRPLEQLEAEVIRFAIAHYRGQMSEVARRLQIGRSTLYRKLDALGLQQRVAENDTGPVTTG
jgi:DNA-binding NtrC family response regulator